jgi:putative PIN family toxin of toxin-antitoxin system
MFVLDTNIVVAALYSRSGASNALLRGVIEGSIPVAVSVALFLEYEDVLTRPEIEAASWATREDVDAVLDAVVAQAKLVTPIHFSPRPFVADPGDEMVLECAMQAGAEAIVTLNTRDFAGLTPWPGIDVIGPGALLQRLKKEQGS